MADIRKLQYIGGQYLLNIPSRLVRSSQWQKGDCLEVVLRSGDSFEVRRIASHFHSKAEAELPALEQEASGLFAFISAGSGMMNPGDYARHSLRLQHVIAKIRRLKQKTNVQSWNASAPATKA